MGTQPRLILEHINDVHNRLLHEIRKQAENCKCNIVQENGKNVPTKNGLSNDYSKST